MKKRILSLIVVLVFTCLSFSNVFAADNESTKFDEEALFPGALKIDYPDTMNGGWQEINLLLPEQSIIPTDSEVMGIQFSYGVQWKDEAKYGEITFNDEELWVNNAITLLETCQNQPWRSEVWIPMAGSQALKYRPLDLANGSLGAAAIKEAAADDGNVGLFTMLAGKVTLRLDEIIPAPGTDPTGGENAVLDPIRMAGIRVGIDATILKQAYMYIGDIEVINEDGEVIGKLFDWNNLPVDTTLEDYIRIGNDGSNNPAPNANYSIVNEDDETSTATIFGETYEGMLEVTGHGLAADKAGYIGVPFDEGKTIPATAAAIEYDYIGRQLAPRYYDPNNSNGYKNADLWLQVGYHTFLSDGENQLYSPGDSVVIRELTNRLFNNGFIEPFGDFPGAVIKAATDNNGKLDIPRSASGRGHISLAGADADAFAGMNEFLSFIKQGQHMNRYFGNVYAVDADGEILETLIDWSTKSSEEAKDLIKFYNDDLTPGEAKPLVRVMNSTFENYEADPETIFTGEPVKPGPNPDDKDKDKDKDTNGTDKPNTGAKFPVAALSVMLGAVLITALAANAKRLDKK